MLLTAHVIMTLETRWNREVGAYRCAYRWPSRCYSIHRTCDISRPVNYKLPLLEIPSIQFPIIFSFTRTLLTFLQSLCVICVVELVQMEPKIICRTQVASSSNPPSINFPSFYLIYSLLKKQENWNLVRNYNIVKERAFEIDNLEGYEE